jgi:hypothetical protein
MLFFFSLIIAATAVVGAFAAPTELVRRQDPIRYVTFIETGQMSNSPLVLAAHTVSTGLLLKVDPE